MEQSFFRRYFPEPGHQSCRFSDRQFNDRSGACPSSTGSFTTGQYFYDCIHSKIR